LRAYADGAMAARHEVRTLELGALDFDPVLRFGYRARMAPDPVIEQSQQWVLWAERLALLGISPIRTVKRNLFANCGIKLTKALSLGRMHTSYDTAQRRERFLQKVASAAGEIG